jgi:hypothetical protein
MLVTICERVAPYDLYPSAVVFSGHRGLHLYWKIDTDVSVATIEAINKQIISWLQGDRRAYDCTRLLRTPGTINRKSGKRVELLHMSGRVFPADAFEMLPPAPPSGSTPVHTASPAIAPDAPWRAAAASLSDWSEHDLRSLRLLQDQFQIYMTDLPAAPWNRWGYPSRSEMEAQIVAYLIGKGWGASDAQIKIIANRYFAKHLEMRDDRYIDGTIASARADLYDRGWISSPMGGYPRERDVKYRHSRTAGHELMSLNFVRGQPPSEWIYEIRDAGVVRSTAYRIKDRLEAAGKIEIVEGRVFRVSSRLSASTSVSALEIVEDRQPTTIDLP